MKEARISLPELALVAGTRAALGFGLGLLLADRWPQERRRRGIGWALFTIGLASTVPLALDVFGRAGACSSAASDSGEAWGRLAGAQNV
ncbi:MAG: hypothetical protein J0I06_18450 [Planctomycetes bacterium]|nr:hypothetical protein [Planctomycetota bacterium]